MQVTPFYCLFRICKKPLLLLIFAILAYLPSVKAQFTGNFIVNGSVNSYYPVTFVDGGQYSYFATKMELGRTIHEDTTWKGSVLAYFRFHASGYGGGSSFIYADIREAQTHQTEITNFIAGWQDISFQNSTNSIVIWLRGGGTTYNYSSTYAVSPTVYDGVQNAVPYSIPNGGTCNVKTATDPYVDTNGINVGGNLTASSMLSLSGTSGLNQVNLGTDLNSAYQFIAGGSASGSPFAGKLMLRYSNYQGNASRMVVDSFGNVAIGTGTPLSLFTVNGTITAKQLNITQTGWSDFVFDSTYQRMPLYQLAAYVHKYKHLPGIPSAGQIAASGLDIGAMQKLHMQKIEELTLDAIQADAHARTQDSIITEQSQMVNQQQLMISQQQQTLHRQQALLQHLQAQLQKQQQELDKLKETQTNH